MESDFTNVEPSEEKKGSIKGWHVLLAWVFFIALVIAAITWAPILIDAAVICLGFAFVWILSEAYGHGH